MVIHPAQMAAFSQSATERFESRMLEHLNTCFPEQCRAWGEPKVRSTIRYGTERASAYGITAQRDVCRYIDLMVLFGPDFDRDSSLPWLSAVLNDRAMRDPTVKLEALYNEGKRHQQRANGNARS